MDNGDITSRQQQLIRERMELEKKRELLRQELEKQRFIIDQINQLKKGNQ